MVIFVVILFCLYLFNLNFFMLFYFNVSVIFFVGDKLRDQKIFPSDFSLHFRFVREIILFIGKPKGRSMMISNATNPLRESRKESLLMCAGSTSICEWFICDLVVMCVQAVGDCALGDFCFCVRCRSIQSQKV